MSALLAYALGLGTLPTLWAAWLFFDAATREPTWYEHGCQKGCPRKWVRADHPLWPWWLWMIAMRVHDRRAGHVPQIREWQAKHTVKAHWWSKREIVR